MLQIWDRLLGFLEHELIHVRFLKVLLDRLHLFSVMINRMGNEKNFSTGTDEGIGHRKSLAVDDKFGNIMTF